MPEYEWNILPEPPKIMKEEADKWMASLGLKFAWDYGGGIRFEGYSYHDVDVNIYPTEETPCPCKELFLSLPSAPFDIQIMCKTCGASLNYFKAKDTWVYNWNIAGARIIKTFPSDMRSISIQTIIEINEKIKALEEKAAKVVK